MNKSNYLRGKSPCLLIKCSPWYTVLGRDLSNLPGVLSPCSSPIRLSPVLYLIWRCLFFPSIDNTWVPPHHTLLVSNRARWVWATFQDNTPHYFLGGHLGKINSSLQATKLWEIAEWVLITSLVIAPLSYMLSISTICVRVVININQSCENHCCLGHKTSGFYPLIL